MLIDLAGSDVVFAREGNVEVSFIVSKIEVNLTAVIEDEYFAVPGMFKPAVFARSRRVFSNSVGAMVPASTFM